MHSRGCVHGQVYLREWIYSTVQVCVSALKAAGPYPIYSTHPLLQEALGSLMEGVFVRGLGKKHVDAPVVGNPVENDLRVNRALIIDVQLVKVSCIFEVILVTSCLQITAEVAS